MVLLASIAVPGSNAKRDRAGHRRRPAVLLVGTYHGHRGQFSSIQAAVDAAKPGDWILVAPGDYHEHADQGPLHGSQPADTPAAVVITKPRIHLGG